MEGAQFPELTHLSLSLVFFIALPFLFLTYRALSGPLAHLPGPAISRWTAWQLKLAVLKGERVRYVHALHEKYGPIVRITPREFAVADAAATQAIYKVGGTYLKTEWYGNFGGRAAERNLFNETDFHKHSHRRRLLAANFSEKWVAQMEPHISKNTQLAVQCMAKEMKTMEYCDVYKWFTCMATDVIGEASFGESFRMLETGQRNQYITDLEAAGSTSVLRSELPLLFSMSRYLPFIGMKDLQATSRRINQYSEDSVNRYWKQLKADPNNVKATLLTKEFALVESGDMTAPQIRADARGNIVAGTDTTAVTATYVVNLLAHHPDIEQALIRQVATLPADFVDEDLRPLKLLSHVISETLRLRSPVSQGLPRYVPPGGATFCGYHVPEGVVVGVQAYTMHRNPDVWKDPEAFDPSRWEAPTKEMNQFFVPFGGGSRVCLGKHFAQMELRHALANFYRTFDRGVRMAYVDGFKEDDLTQLGFFLEQPKGHRCLVEARKK